MAVPMMKPMAPSGARRVLLGPLWQWAIVLVIVMPLAFAFAAWGGAFNDSAEAVARNALRAWSIVLFSSCVAWLTLVLPGVVLSTLAARRRGTPGLVGQGASLFWAGMLLVGLAVAGSLAVWIGLGGWPG
ncbi:MAG: hypothetical protein CL897_04070 [Dehalococcoidia bacterium]|nr:hypothetical protein [Dehalococcoidia bacterium]HCV00831.1 hypothetical protein [Dehalococcoidia bacterium]